MRPGTYDILNARYDQAPDLYFDWSAQRKESCENNKEFRLSLNKIRAITEQLEKHNLEIDVVEFLIFYSQALNKESLQNLISQRIFQKSYL